MKIRLSKLNWPSAEESLRYSRVNSYDFMVNLYNSWISLYDSKVSHNSRIRTLTPW
jgi:hypothetical protein